MFTAACIYYVLQFEYSILYILYTVYCTVCIQFVVQIYTVSRKFVYSMSYSMFVDNTFYSLYMSMLHLYCGSIRVLAKFPTRNLLLVIRLKAANLVSITIVNRQVTRLTSHTSSLCFVERTSVERK